MKNRIWILFILVLLVTGCTNINNVDYMEIAKLSVSSKTDINLTSNGYSLFIPKGMVLISEEASNMTFYSDNKKYYLYVDLTSYYNKIENSYVNTKNSTYNKTFKLDEKNANILIKEYDDKYYLSVYYNYAKIEVITDKIKEDVAKSMIILNSIRYNDTIIKSLIGNTTFDYDEEQYNLDTPNLESRDTSGSQFLKYEEDYGDYEEQLKDEDTINIQNTDN